ncbi:hypothetical protein AQUCO_03000402v1 [Aquilegia coerulea]|uniref:TF-B3 domain-containing protein n=1 Tax=Aquilegia coerulea TaxID=218851 RepID=A0A2G5D2X5_AQUCA|nr:hypothetical protein AQUCO_03000402v1 [Aquilegia coerulea]
MVVEEEELALDEILRQGAENLKYMSEKPVNMETEAFASLQEQIETQPLIPPVERLRKKVIGPCYSWEKNLKKSDVDGGQRRLMLSSKDFAVPSVNQLLRDKDDVTKGVEVRVYDNYGEKYKMEYKRWGTKAHVLHRGWNEFRKNHGLVEHKAITLWAFRRKGDQSLCFAII